MSTHGAASRSRWADGWLYGGLGLPLAFVALPLYVILPDHYTRQFGMPLTTLAALLLGVRLMDALIDPWIGRWVDRQLNHSALTMWRSSAVAAVLLAAGFTALFFPPETISQQPHQLELWCAGALVLTYAAYSVMTVAHQAWGARLGGNEVQRVRIVAWREGLALVGVLLASVLAPMAGLLAMVVCFVGLLAAGLACLARAPRPPTEVHLPRPAQPLWAELIVPWRNRAFVRLLTVFLLNGIAMAIPANLVMFFINDRLQAPAFAPLFLGAYFAAAACSTPLWSRLVGPLGLVRCWALGMGLSVLTFSGAWLVGSGDVALFVLVCVLSGIALGADLALPGALLAGVIQRGGHARAEGAYFGWWNFANKLNLALAAGIAFPVLDQLGYTAGHQEEEALRALSVVYCLVPCLLKLAAGGALYGGLMRPARTNTTPSENLP